MTVNMYKQDGALSTKSVTRTQGYTALSSGTGDGNVLDRWRSETFIILRAALVSGLTENDVDHYMFVKVISLAKKTL